MQCTKLWKNLLKKVKKVDNCLGIIVMSTILKLLINLISIKIFMIIKEFIFRKVLIILGDRYLIRILFLLKICIKNSCQKQLLNLNF